MSLTDDELKEMGAISDRFDAEYQQGMDHESGLDFACLMADKLPRCLDEIFDLKRRLAKVTAQRDSLRESMK